MRRSAQCSRSAAVPARCCSNCSAPASTAGMSAVDMADLMIRATWVYTAMTSNSSRPTASTRHSLMPASIWCVRATSRARARPAHRTHRTGPPLARLSLCEGPVRAQHARRARRAATDARHRQHQRLHAGIFHAASADVGAGPRSPGVVRSQTESHAFSGSRLKAHVNRALRSGLLRANPVVASRGFTHHFGAPFRAARGAGA
jgi:hypothetical protein